jgi:hypothetical protein
MDVFSSSRKKGLQFCAFGSTFAAHLREERVVTVTNKQDLGSHLLPNSAIPVVSHRRQGIDFKARCINFKPRDYMESSRVFHRIAGIGQTL